MSPVTMGYDVQYRLATTVDTCIDSTNTCTCSTLSWQELSCLIRLWCWKTRISQSVLYTLCKTYSYHISLIMIMS